MQACRYTHALAHTPTNTYTQAHPCSSTQDEVGVDLPNGYYDEDSCSTKFSNMKRAVKEIMQSLRDSHKNASGRALTAEVCGVHDA